MVPFPPGSTGRVNVHENAPFESVVILLPPDVPTEHATAGRSSASKETVASELTSNPEPLTANVLPTEPWVGPATIAGVVTVKDTAVLWPPASVASTVLPEVPLGTETSHENAPELLVVRDPLEQPMIATPSNTNDASKFETEKPAPESVTPVPTGPCAGETAMDSGVTLNVAVADGPTTSVALTVVPEVPLETASVHEKPPDPFVVSEPLKQTVTDTPSKTSDVNAVDNENALPETVTVAPTGPCLGVTVIAGAIKVNVAEAAFVPSDATIV